MASEKITARFKEPHDLFDVDGMSDTLMFVAGLKITNGSTDFAVLIKAFEGLEFDCPGGKVVIRPEDYVAIQYLYVVRS